MTSTQAKIQQAAHKHEQLMRALEETDSAPAQLKQQVAYINDLDTQINDTTKRLKGLRAKTTIESIDYEKYRDSHVRRWAHKATGRKERFAEKAAKEEKEYFEAEQAQKSAEDELAYSKQLRAEAEVPKGKYEETAQRHQQAQAELDALYNSIFAGYTPEFPDEDQKENACQAAQRRVQDLTQPLERERQILFLLRQTVTKLNEVRDQLGEAHGLSQIDMFGGGAYASMAKRNYLEKAESCIQQVRMLQDQLRMVAPEIPNLGPLDIAVGDIFTDVFFDNIFTDMDMHDKIKASIRKVDSAGHRCGDIIKEREQQEMGMREDLKAAQGSLQYARVDLQKTRMDAFKRVLGGEQGSTGSDLPQDAPPPYSM